MVHARRRVRAFTLVELLVVISIIALLLAILMPVLGKASKAAKSTRCKARLSQLFKGVRVYWNYYDEYFPLAWHTGHMSAQTLGGLTYWRFMIHQECSSGFHPVVSQRDLDRNGGSYPAAREEKFRENKEFWTCPDKRWTSDYFAPILVFKWPKDSKPYDKHRQLSEVTQDIADSQRPMLSDVNASLPDDEASDPNDGQHQQEMKLGFSYVRDFNIDIFIGVGESLRNLHDWDTTRFDFRHNDAINVLFIDGHVQDAKRDNRSLLARLHRRWNSLTISASDD